MIAWFSSLDAAQKIFAAMAVPATLILIIQSVLLIFGFGGHGGDVGSDVSADLHGDVSGDAHGDLGGDGHPDGVALFSVRGIVAFFAVGGWLGIALIESGVSLALTVVLSLIAGFLALYAIALIMRASLKLQSSGNLNLTNAVGLTGRVYIRIPAAGKGVGKVTLTLQERFSELEAVTQEDRDLLADELVLVTGVQGETVLTVQPCVKEEAPQRKPVKSKVQVKQGGSIHG